MVIKPWKKWTLAVFILAVVALIILLVPIPETPQGELSSRYYTAGTLGIVEDEFAVVDVTRATAPNRDYAGAPERTLNGMIWYPEDARQGPYPLLVYSHGFMSRYQEAAGVAEFLVPHGYVLVAVNYPLTHYFAPGGPAVEDVANQAGDVSFIIDQILARSEDPANKLHLLVDPSRIGLLGLSLGGMTTTLAAYHRDQRDPRVKAALSIAGPTAMFGPRFFDTSNIPFMMIAGDADAIVPYQDNAVPILAKIPASVLVTLKNASHTGFAPIAGLLFRFAHNPDQIGCRALMSNLDQRDQNAGFTNLGGSEIGIISAPSTLPCRMQEFPRAMRPGRQQMLTVLTAFSFFESVMSQDEARRRGMSDFLLHHLDVENEGVLVQSGQ